MMDVHIEVHRVRCRFSFLTPEAQAWACANFDALSVDVNIWRAKNLVHAILAEGLEVTPGAATSIERIQRGLLTASARAGNPRERRLRQLFDTLQARLACARMSGVAKPTTVKILLVQWFGVATLTILLTLELIRKAEPLISIFRGWRGT
jgi:hypothetical protein